MGVKPHCGATSPQKLGTVFAKSGISNNNRVLIYSDGRDVLGATMVAYLLERSGVRNIAVLEGGYSGYMAAGEPITAELDTFQNTA